MTGEPVPDYAGRVAFALGHIDEDFAGTKADGLESLNALVSEDERFRSLQKLYGAKFNAISAALGFACEAQKDFQGDSGAGFDSGMRHLERVIEILVDA